jgi:hypothetical protein
MLLSDYHKIKTYQNTKRKIVTFCTIKLQMCEKQLYRPLILMLHIYIYVLTLMWQHHHSWSYKQNVMH